MQLWMIRHAEAMSTWETGGSDFDRPLTEDGRAEFGALCRQLRDRPAPQRILHSPRLRAVETAEILRRSFDLPESVLEMVPELGEAPLVGELVAATADRDESVVAVVGHQPSMGHLVYTLTGRSVRYSPGTIAAIEFANGSVAKEMGELLWSESP